MPDTTYTTGFGSLASFEKGGVQMIDDKVTDCARPTGRVGPDLSELNNRP